MKVGDRVVVIKACDYFYAEPGRIERTPIYSGHKRLIVKYDCEVYPYWQDAENLAPEDSPEAVAILVMAI